MAHMVGLGMVWCRQVIGAINCMMQFVILSLSDLLSIEYSYEDFKKKHLKKNESLREDLIN